MVVLLGAYSVERKGEKMAEPMVAPMAGEKGEKNVC